MEANNIFIFQNIQHEEEDLEKLKLESQHKIRRVEHLVSKILSNLHNYEIKINEKRSQANGLEDMMSSFDRRNEEEAKGSPAKNKKKVAMHDSAKKEEVPPATIKDLLRTILRIYKTINKRGSEMDEGLALLQDPLHLLREIESSVTHMFEEKGFIEELATKNTDVSKRLAEAERVVDRDRKQIRY